MSARCLDPLADLTHSDFVFAVRDWIVSRARCRDWLDLVAERRKRLGGDKNLFGKTLALMRLVARCLALVESKRQTEKII